MVHFLVIITLILCDKVLFSQTDNRVTKIVEKKNVE